jgi:hypothetical protein
MDFQINDTGDVLAINVVNGSAADRTSDKFGNLAPIRENDEIVEINFVYLKVEIFSV